ncbi:hypothetical protein [Candidatus Methylocalor cossyra]
MAPLVDRLFGKLLRVFLASARRSRKLAELEFRQYRKLEARVSGITPGSPRAGLFRLFLDEPAIRLSLRANCEYRLIDIHELTASDRAFLAAHGLGVEYLSANSSGIWLDRLEDSFQLEFVAAGNLQAVCPWTGKRLASNRSFLYASGQPIYYRFETGERTFYLAVGRDTTGFNKLYMYLAGLDTVIILGDRDWSWLGRHEIDHLRAYLIRNWSAVCRYLARSTAPTPCCFVDTRHFAHHIWNALTGFQKLATSPYHLERLQKLLITAEPMGPIDGIFPELKGKPIVRAQVRDLPRLALKDHLFLFRLGGNKLGDQVLQRLYRVALDNTPGEIVKEAREFGEKYWPILWVTIRTGNRTWVSQAEGIAAIANRLKHKYPGFALVIDGYCLPQDYPSPSYEDAAPVLDKERQVIRTIMGRLGSHIPVKVVAGRPICESLIYARLIDYYLAHHGAIQHKIGWFSKKPGVVHSNRTVLSGRPESHIAFWSQENGVPPRYLDAQWVTDVSGAAERVGSRWQFALDNYDFDHRHAYETLLGLMTAAETGRAPPTRGQSA